MDHRRLLDTVRGWMARRRETVPVEEEPGPDGWDEVMRAGQAADDAAIRFRHSFAELQAEVMKSRGRGGKSLHD